jgi:hypothetical protein
VSASALSGSREMLAMSSPANLTDSASRRKRLPPHSWQSWPIMNWATRRFISALWLVAKVWSTWRRALVKVPW